jgi:hypothetical protein
MGGDEAATDIIRDLSYYGLFDIAEQARWTMAEIPWGQIQMSAVDDRLISLVRGAMFGELTTYSATHAFMTLFTDDIDFTQWLSVWLYEETKHPHALAKWLSEVGQPLSATFVREGRVISPMAVSRVEMLTFNIISEVVAGLHYSRTSVEMPEPVLKIIMRNLGKDELRHSQGFEHYCKKLIRSSEDPDRERMLCLRAAWAFLQGEHLIEHPVLLTANAIAEFADADTVEKTRAQIRVQVTRRIAGVVEIEIPDPEAVYEAYRTLRAKYRKGKAVPPAPLAS